MIKRLKGKGNVDAKYFRGGITSRTCIRTTFAKLVDITGRILKSFRIQTENTRNTSFEMNLSDIQSGIYLLKSTSVAGISAIKITKF